MGDLELPRDLAAEKSVLGSVLVENRQFSLAAAIVQEGHFFREGHRAVWRAFARLDALRQPIDFVTLREALERAGDLEEAGGPAYLSSLMDGVPRASNIESYAQIVRDKATRRDLIAAARATLAEAFDGDDALDEVLSRAEARLLTVGRATARGDFLLAEDWIGEMFPVIDRASSERRAVTGVPCGLGMIDHLTRGWQPTDLVIIAGRPSDGKTSLMLQFALEASRHTFTTICSLEMSRQSVGFRAIALEARVDAFGLMTGRLKDHEMARVGDAMSRLAERRLAIDDSAGQTVTGLCGKVRRLAARYGTGIVFVDYLQLLHGTGENRTQEITQISGRLKALAKELNCPVVALSQLTRENARQGASTRPQLHNLRDGGSIEQDADVVLMIHRPNRQTETSRFEDGEAVELILAKQRNGPAGVVREAVWHAASMRFTDRSAPEAAQPTLAEARS